MYSRIIVGHDCTYKHINYLCLIYSIYMSRCVVFWGNAFSMFLILTIDYILMILVYHMPYPLYAYHIRNMFYHLKYTRTSLIRNSEIRAPHSTGQSFQMLIPNPWILFDY